jgi:hypothetical protein
LVPNGSVVPLDDILLFLLSAGNSVRTGVVYTHIPEKQG